MRSSARSERGELQGKMSHAVNTDTTLTMTVEDGERADPRMREVLLAPPSVTTVTDQLAAAACEQCVDLTGPSGLMTGLKPRVLQTALTAELITYLAYDSGDRPEG